MLAAAAVPELRNDRRFIMIPPKIRSQEFNRSQKPEARSQKGTLEELLP
jgi:hypothetical protein